jgi:hypothetical protein
MFASLWITLNSASLLLAQARPAAPKSSDGAEFLAIFFSCCCPALVMLVFMAPMYAGMWKAFAKAGQPGWAAIVPIYQIYVLCKIAGKEDFRFLLWMIPMAGIIFAIIDTIDFCKAYGKEAGFAIGMLILPYVFWPILGFGSAEYVGVPSSSSARRRSRRYEEEEEYEDEPRPRRRRREEDEE